MLFYPREEIFDRLAKRGHMADMAPVRKILERYTMEELVVTRKQANGACFYRLAEGEAVEMALNEAWTKAETEQRRNEKPES